EGTSYMRVKAKNGAGLWSGVAVYTIHVDTTAAANLTISSSSHPDQNAWSANTTANFSWSASDTSGIAGYAWCFDQANTCDPGTTASANTSSPPQTAPRAADHTPELPTLRHLVC